LDSPFTIFLALLTEYDIVLYWDVNRQGKMGYVREEYKVENARGTVMIYYLGNGSGGHYQAIIPEGAYVIFN
jgi:hypothetical protein